MESLLSNPAIQSAVVPFTLTLVTVLALMRMSWKWAGIGLIIGFLACVYLSMGIEFSPMTSTRKVIVLALVAFALALVLDFTAFQHKWLGYILAVAGALAVIWIIWRYAERQEGFQPWLIIITSMLYCGLIIYGNDRLASNADKSLPALLVLAIGTSVSAVLGASASLGQLAGAVAASLGVYFLLHLLKNNVTLPRNLSLTASCLMGWMGVAAVIYAKLPWYTLLLLLCIPFILLFPLPRRAGKIPGIILNAIYTAPFAGLSIFITFKIAGAPPF